MFDSKMYKLSAEGRSVQCLTRLPNLMSRSKAALGGSHQNDIVELRILAHGLRDELSSSLSTLRQRWHENTTEIVDPKKPLYTDLMRCHFLRSYALGLAIAIFINEVRLALCPDAADIQEESHEFALEILDLAGAALQYRPLGSYVLGICLLAADYGARDAEMKIAIRKMQLDYASDFQGTEGLESVQELQLICGRKWSPFLDQNPNAS